jgi:hypothetical protein
MNGQEVAQTGQEDDAPRPEPPGQLAGEPVAQGGPQPQARLHTREAGLHYNLHCSR